MKLRMNKLIKPNFYLILIMINFIMFRNYYFAFDYSVIKGKIDFDKIDINKNPIKLNGEWEFYWNKLLLFNQFENSNKIYWEAESPWNSYLHNGKEVGSFGYATYKIELHNLPKDKLNILIKSPLCAIKLFIDDKLVEEIGKVDNCFNSYKPAWIEKIVTVPRNKKNLTLIAQISNFHHRKGGFEKPLLIGLEKHIYDIKNKSILYKSFVTSAFIFAGLFFFILFIFRNKDRSLIYFSLSCLFSSPRAFFSDDYLISSFFPNINWNFLIHIEYISLIVPGIFILLFIREMFNGFNYEKIIYLLIFLSILEVIITLIFPPNIFTWVVLIHEVLTIISIIIISLIIYKAFKINSEGSVFAIISILSLILSAILTIIDYLYAFNSFILLNSILQMSFVLMMSMILGSQFSSKFKKLEILQIKTIEQNKQLEVQKNSLEYKNKEILDSLTYAKRIQSAILPQPKLVKEFLEDSFILYKPKDIVAGDFYWLEIVEDNVLFAAADCTGHGVPGAMVSVVCNNGLNRAVREHKLIEPDQILNKTRELVIEEFEKSDEEVNDGMDISLCVLNLETFQLKWAGANNPLWILRNGEIIEYKGDKQPIGKHYDSKPFSLIDVQLEKNDIIYIFTDGFQDQFGGAKEKKFRAAQMKELLLSLIEKSMEEQRKMIDTSFESWKGELEQVDDVCVIGVRV
jgi:serine phosphatase RsbU (regulator of sigma subunit)